MKFTLLTNLLSYFLWCQCLLNFFNRYVNFLKNLCDFFFTQHTNYTQCLFHSFSLSHKFGSYCLLIPCSMMQKCGRDRGSREQKKISVIAERVAIIIQDDNFMAYIIDEDDGRWECKGEGVAWSWLHAAIGPLWIRPRTVAISSGQSTQKRHHSAWILMCFFDWEFVTCHIVG